MRGQRSMSRAGRRQERERVGDGRRVLVVGGQHGRIYCERRRWRRRERAGRCRRNTAAAAACVGERGRTHVCRRMHSSQTAGCVRGNTRDGGRCGDCTQSDDGRGDEHCRPSRQRDARSTNGSSETTAARTLYEVAVAITGDGNAWDRGVRGSGGERNAQAGRPSHTPPTIASNNNRM